MTSLIHSEPALVSGTNSTHHSDLVVRARFLVLEAMVEMLWTDRLSRLSDPAKEARDFKNEVIGSVAVLLDRDDDQKAAVHDMTLELMSDRLDSIIERVDSLQPKRRVAARGFR